MLASLGGAQLGSIFSASLFHVAHAVWAECNSQLVVVELCLSPVAMAVPDSARECFQLLPSLLPPEGNTLPKVPMAVLSQPLHSHDLHSHLPSGTRSM